MRVWHPCGAGPLPACPSHVSKFPHHHAAPWKWTTAPWTYAPMFVEAAAAAVVLSRGRPFSHRSATPAEGERGQVGTRGIAPSGGVARLGNSEEPTRPRSLRAGQGRTAYSPAEPKWAVERSLPHPIVTPIRHNCDTSSTSQFALPFPRWHENRSNVPRLRKPKRTKNLGGRLLGLPSVLTRRTSL